MWHVTNKKKQIASSTNLHTYAFGKYHQKVINTASCPRALTKQYLLQDSTNHIVIRAESPQSCTSHKKMDTKCSNTVHLHYVMDQVNYSDLIVITFPWP